MSDGIYDGFISDTPEDDGFISDSGGSSKQTKEPDEYDAIRSGLRQAPLGLGDEASGIMNVGMSQLQDNFYRLGLAKYPAPDTVDKQLQNKNSVDPDLQMPELKGSDKFTSPTFSEDKNAPSYTSARDEVRVEDEAAEKAHPAYYYGANIVGGTALMPFMPTKFLAPFGEVVAPTIGKLATSPLKTIAGYTGKQIVNSAANSVPISLAIGAGTSKADNLMDLGVDMGISTTVGAVASPLLDQAVIPAIGAVLKPIGKTIKDNAVKAGEFINSLESEPLTQFKLGYKGIAAFSSDTASKIKQTYNDILGPIKSSINEKSLQEAIEKNKALQDITGKIEINQQEIDFLNKQLSDFKKTKIETSRAYISTTHASEKARVDALQATEKERVSNLKTTEKNSIGTEIDNVNSDILGLKTDLSEYKDSAIKSNKDTITKYTNEEAAKLEQAITKKQAEQEAHMDNYQEELFKLGSTYRKQLQDSEGILGKLKNLLKVDIKKDGTENIARKIQDSFGDDVALTKAQFQSADNLAENMNVQFNIDSQIANFIKSVEEINGLVSGETAEKLLKVNTEMLNQLYSYKTKGNTNRKQLKELLNGSTNSAGVKNPSGLKIIRNEIPQEYRYLYEDRLKTLDKSLRGTQDVQLRDMAKQTGNTEYLRLADQYKQANASWTAIKDLENSIIPKEAGKPRIKYSDPEFFAKLVGAVKEIGERDLDVATGSKGYDLYKKIIKYHPDNQVEQSILPNFGMTKEDLDDFSKLYKQNISQTSDKQKHVDNINNVLGEIDKYSKTPDVRATTEAIQGVKTQDGVALPEFISTNKTKKDEIQNVLNLLKEKKSNPQISDYDINNQKLIKAAQDQNDTLTSFPLEDNTYNAQQQTIQTKLDELKMLKAQKASPEYKTDLSPSPEYTESLAYTPEANQTISKAQSTIDTLTSKFPENHPDYAEKLVPINEKMNLAKSLSEEKAALDMPKKKDFALDKLKDMGSDNQDKYLRDLFTAADSERQVGGIGSKTEELSKLLQDLNVDRSRLDPKLGRLHDMLAIYGGDLSFALSSSGNAAIGGKSLFGGGANILGGIIGKPSRVAGSINKYIGSKQITTNSGLKSIDEILATIGNKPLNNVLSMSPEGTGKAALMNNLLQMSPEVRQYLENKKKDK